MLNVNYLEQLILSMEKGVLKLEEYEKNSNINGINQAKVFLMSIYTEINKFLGVK